MGIRVPGDIKKRFDEYWKKGTEKSFLFSKMIKEKMSEFEEDEMNLELTKKRRD